MYTEEFLKKVKSFGVLQYSADRMISVLAPADPDQFKKDFSDPESVVYIMYQAGFNSGQYMLDVQQYKQAEIETDIRRFEYEQLKERLALRKQLFNV
jgi:hypothetical protein